MTREEILAMKPGVQLDALVAEKFGVDTWKPFFPSTEINYAWEVVEIITKESESDGCGPIIEITHDGVWHAKIGIHRSQANTAPEAICKTALLAVMEDNS